MALTPGTVLGPYEITGTLGKGGMGEVYRGRDPKLERDVAIKVLPESFASDASRVARFDQEAKMLAALNHPHIAHVYGLEQTDGQPAIVMELVEGPTLADRIAQGPVPADEALGIAMQIADALEAAHERGIVHRDLKPANIKLRPDGAIKVLDFGIAKAAAPERSDGGASPIMTTPATQIGVILGTAAYMSPEQARGKPVDQRTDVWAFGCVLYELLTGQLAFGGEDVAVTLARVIANDTDLDSLPATISPAVQRTIELCLRKDPRKRVADIRDVKLALAGEFDTAGSSGAATAGEAAAASARRGPGWAGLAAAALVTAVAAAAVTFLFFGNDEPPPRRGTRFTIEMPDGGTLALDDQSQSLAISPDGRTIAFATGRGNRYAWYLRPVDVLRATPLRGAREGFETPFFSPDGRWLGFDDGELWRLSALGATPTRIGRLNGRARGARWGENDEIVFGVEGSGLWIASADGGEPQQLTELESGTGHRWPDWLPGNRAAVFALQRGESSQIAVVERASGNVSVLIPDGLSPVWLDGGHLVYGIVDGSLRAVRFDAERLAIVGDPVEINGIGDEPIAISATMGMHYALAADGTLLYGTRSASNIRGNVPQQLGWLTSTGEFAPLSIDPCYCFQAEISPDGTSVAMTIIENFDAGRLERDIWVLSLRNDSLRRLTFEAGYIADPVWSPDSTRIAYRDVERGIVIRRADGTGEIETMPADPDAESSSWAPDNRLLFDRPGAGARDIVAIEARPGAEPVPLLATDAGEGFPVVSPDGRWLAYETDSALFVRPYPNVSGGQWQITGVGNGTFRFAWSSDSARLYFLRDGQLMVTDIEAEPAFSVGTPRPVADFGDHIQAGFIFGFAVERGTNRILAAAPVGDSLRAEGIEAASSRLVVIQDFDEMVSRLLPLE